MYVGFHNSAINIHLKSCKINHLKSNNPIVSSICITGIQTISPNLVNDLVLSTIVSQQGRVVTTEQFNLNYHYLSA